MISVKAERPTHSDPTPPHPKSFFNAEEAGRRFHRPNPGRSRPTIQIATVHRQHISAEALHTNKKANLTEGSSTWFQQTSRLSQCRISLLEHPPSILSVSSTQYCAVAALTFFEYRHHGCWRLLYLHPNMPDPYPHPHHGYAGLFRPSVCIGQSPHSGLHPCSIHHVCPRSGVVPCYTLSPQVHSPISPFRLIHRHLLHWRLHCRRIRA